MSFCYFFLFLFIRYTFIAGVPFCGFHAVGLVVKAEAAHFLDAPL